MPFFFTPIGLDRQHGIMAVSLSSRVTLNDTLTDKNYPHSVLETLTSETKIRHLQVNLLLTDTSGKTNEWCWSLRAVFQSFHCI